MSAAAEQEELFETIPPPIKGPARGLWVDVQDAAERSQAQVDAVASKVAGFKGWRLVGVVDGYLWTARHRLHGTLETQQVEELLAAIERYAARDALERRARKRGRR